MTALAELLARVEAAEGPDRELDFDLERLTLEGDGWEREDCGPRYSPKWIRAEGDGRYFVHGVAPHLTGSVDAALALVDRVLPGLVIDMCRIGRPGNQFQVHEVLIYSGEDSDVEEVERDYWPVRPGALAILEALLRALLAKDAAP